MDSGVGALVELLNETCPQLAPAVLPSGLRIRSLAEIPASPQQHTQLATFLAESSTGGAHLSLVTSIDFIQRRVDVSLRRSDAVTNQLTCPDKMLSLIVKGDKHELDVLRARFAEENIDSSGNGVYNGPGGAFEQAYNLAAALKVLLSNTPGLNVTFGGATLPLTGKEDLAAVLRQVKIVDKGGSKRKGAKKLNASGVRGGGRACAGEDAHESTSRAPGSHDDSSDSSDSDGSEEEQQGSNKKPKKNKKRKRGKGGK